MAERHTQDATPTQPNHVQRVPEGHLSRKGIALAIAGACLFSTKPILIKFVYDYPIDAVTLMTLRMGFSLPFYLVFAIVAWRQRARQNIDTDYSARTLARTATIGIVGYYIASYLDLVGLTMVTAQFERLILFTYPTFVILLGAVLFGHRVTRRFLAALAITYAGLAVIFGQDLHLFGSEIVLGSAFVLGAAISFAGYILFSQFEISRLGARLFTCFAMIAASAAIILHFLATHPVAMLIQPQQVYGLTLLVAILSTVLPTFLIAAAIEQIGAGPTAMLSGIGPLFTTILGISLLGEPFTPWHLVGMILVLSGALLLSQKSTRS